MPEDHNNKFNHDPVLKIELYQHIVPKHVKEFRKYEFLGDRVLNLALAEAITTIMDMSIAKGFFSHLVSNRNYQSYCDSLNLKIDSDSLEVIAYNIHVAKDYVLLGLLANDIVKFTCERSNYNVDALMRQTELIDKKELESHQKSLLPIVVDTSQEAHHVFNQYVQMSGKVPIERTTSFNNGFVCEIQIDGMTFHGRQMQTKKAAKSDTIQMVVNDYLRGELIDKRRRDSMREEANNNKLMVQMKKEKELLSETKETIILKAMVDIIVNVIGEFQYELKAPTDAAAVYVLMSMTMDEELLDELCSTLELKLNDLFEEYFQICNPILVVKSSEMIVILVRCGMKNRLDVLSKVLLLQSALELKH